jgi:hypothetical protein
LGSLIGPAFLVFISLRSNIPPPLIQHAPPWSIFPALGPTAWLRQHPCLGHPGRMVFT